jgi:5-methylcytosine-specific restriction endonuclease McrA
LAWNAGADSYYNLGVSELKLPSATRIGIWQAYSRKCAYCGDPIVLGELDIDHIVPEKLNENKEELERAKADLGLPPGFEVNSLGNLVPAHRRCNLAKAGRVFHPSRARYFLEIAAGKETAVRRCIEAIALQDRKDRLLSGLRASLESGAVTVGDLSGLVSGCESFPVSADVAFFDGPVERRIHQDEIEELLDKQVLLGGTQSKGLSLLNFFEQT